MAVDGAKGETPMRYWCKAVRTVRQTVEFEVDADTEEDAWEKADAAAQQQDFNAGEDTTDDIEVTDVEFDDVDPEFDTKPEETLQLDSPESGKLDVN